MSIWLYLFYLIVGPLVALFVPLYASEPFRRWFFATVFTSGLMDYFFRLFIDHRNNWLKGLRELKSDPNNKLVILEVGVGEGSNFDLYPDNSKLIALDYNINFKSAFEKKIAKYPQIELSKYMQGDVQNMHQIEDNSVDVVIITHVFCSVPDVSKGLAEVKRILKPSGKLFFFEHVGFKDHLSTKYCAMALLQKVMTPVWKIIMGGCTLHNTHWIDFENAGFSKLTINHVYPDNLPAFIKPHIYGWAQK